MQFLRIPFLGIFACLALCVSACEIEEGDPVEPTEPSADAGGSADIGSEPDAAPADLVINGSYTDTFNGTHEVSNDTWVMTFAGDPPSTLTLHIESYENDAQYLIAENGEDDTYNAGLYSRIDWTWDADDILYYCQVAFDAASAEDAEATEPPNDNSPNLGGCGGSSFPWTALTAAE